MPNKFTAIILYCSTYFKTGVPYTATMFLIGATMGYFSLNSSHDNAIVESIRIWL